MANGMKPQQPKVQAKAGAFTAKALAKLGSNQQKLGQAIGDIVAANFDDQNVTDDDKRVKIVDLIIKRIKGEVLEGEHFGTFSQDQLDALTALVSDAISQSAGSLSEESRKLLTETIVSQLQSSDSADLDIDTLRGLLEEEFNDLKDDVSKDLDDSIPKPDVSAKEDFSAKIDSLTEIANQQLSRLDKIIESPALKGSFFTSLFKNPFSGLFDKINGKFSDLNKGLKAQFGKIGSFVTAPFKKLNDSIKSGLGRIGGLVTKPFKALGDKLGSLKRGLGSMFTSPFKKLGSLFHKTPKEKKAEKKRDSIFDELDKIIKKLKKWAANISKMMIDFINDNVIPIMKAIGRGIGELIAAIFKVPIVALITAVILGTMTLLAITFFMLVDWIKNDVWPKIKEFLDQMEPEDIKTMMHGIANIIDVIGSALGYIMMPLRLISRACDFIIGLIDRLMVPVLDAIAAVVKAILPVLAKVVIEVVKILGDIVIPIIKGLGAVLKPLAKVVGMIFSAIGSIIEKTLPIIESLIGTIIDTVVAIIEALKPVVEAVLGVVVSAVQLIAGIVTSIYEGVKWVIDFVKDLPSKIWNFIKGGLSKVLNIGKAMSNWAREKMAPLADWSIWGYHPFGFLKGTKEKQKKDGNEETEEEADSSDEEKSSLWEKIDAAFQDLNSKIDEIWDWGKETLYQRLKTKIVAACRLLDKQIHAVMKDLEDKVRAPLISKVQEAYTGLSKMMFGVAMVSMVIGSAVAKAMKSGLKDLHESMTSSKFIDKVVEAISASPKMSPLLELSPIVNALTEIVQRIATDIVDLADAVIESVQNGFASLTEQLAARDQSLIEKISELVSLETDPIFQIVNAMSGILTDFVNNFQEAVDMMTGKVEEILSQVITKIDDVKDNIDDLVSQVDNLSESKVAQIEETSKGWFSEAASKISNMLKPDQQMADQLEQQKEEEHKRARKNDPMDDRFKLLYKFLADNFGLVIEKLDNTNETIVNMVSEDSEFGAIKDF